MKKIEVMAIIGLLIGGAYILYPEQMGKIIKEVVNPAPKHYKTCNILLKRDLGSPWIDSYTCSTGNTCSGVAAMAGELQNNIGDYVGKIKLDIGSNSKTQDYAIGTGVPIFGSANLQIEMTQCIEDSAIPYPSKITLYDGAMSVKATKEFTITVP
jgi:hypothetical protein